MTDLKKTTTTIFTLSNRLHEFSSEARDPLWNGPQLTSEFLGWIIKVPGFRLHDTTVINQAAKRRDKCCTKPSLRK